jgi:hypothetical protein
MPRQHGILGSATAPDAGTWRRNFKKRKRTENEKDSRWASPDSGFDVSLGRAVEQCKKKRSGDETKVMEWLRRESLRL